MAVFEYKALNSQGRPTKGLVDADNIRAARQRLKQQGIFPTSMEETRSKLKSRGWNLNFDLKRRGVNGIQLGVATRQLATLVGAGMPIVESLKALGDQLDHETLKQVFAEVCDLVNEGSTLADALRRYPKVFPKLYVNMVGSGEVSGTLEMVLERLSDLLETQAAMRRKITAALTYPVLMLVLCFGVIVLLLTYVVPQITEIFANQKQVLPLPTRIIITLSDFTKGYWWLVALVIVGIVVFAKRFASSPAGRKKIDTVILKLPLVGAITLKTATARFSRNLGTMLTSGIEVLTALTIVKNIVGNTVLETIIDNAIEGVREGRGLAPELDKGHVFPKLLIHMVAIGEKTGQLESMLLRAATSYESEVNAVITGLTSILEPLLIIVLAVIVGGILASVMLPMLEMSSLAV